MSSFRKKVSRNFKVFFQSTQEQLMNIHSNIQLTIFSSKASSWLLHVVWVGFQHLLGFPFGSAGKESACNAGDMGSILGLGRSPGKGKGYPFQYSGLENSGDFIVHGVAKSQTQLSDFHLAFVAEKWNLQGAVDLVFHI